MASWFRHWNRVSSKFPTQATLVVKLQEFGSAKEGEVSRIMEILSEKSEGFLSCLFGAGSYYGLLWYIWKCLCPFFLLAALEDA